MRTILQIAAFRALAPDDGAGGGAASIEDSSSNDPASVDGEFDVEAAADAAYEAATGEWDDHDTTEDGDDPDGEGPVADADLEPSEDGPYAEDAPEYLPAEIVESYPMARFFSDLNTGLSDPATAPQTLRWLAQETAATHGTTVEAMLGLAPQGDPDEYDDGSPDDERADYERAGYDSPGELRLARELAELRATLRPFAQERAEARSRADWEGAIQSIAPSAIAALRAEMGWQATPAQALDAARRFPQLASQPEGLKEALAATFARDIARTARGAGERPSVPEMPNGERRGGYRALGADERTDVQKLADRAYERLA